MHISYTYVDSICICVMYIYNLIFYGHCVDLLQSDLHGLGLPPVIPGLLMKIKRAFKLF